MARLKYVMVGVLLTTQACLAQSAPVAEQDEDHWVVLDVRDARSEDGRLAWDSEPKGTGRYVVQTISTGLLAEATVEVAGEQLYAILMEDFLIEAGTVSGCKRYITFKKAGRYSLAIQQPARQARLEVSRADSCEICEGMILEKPNAPDTMT